MTTADTTAIPPQAEKKKAGRFNRFDNPLLNWKFITGASMIGALLLAVFLGSIFWDTDLARAASSPQSLPPYGFTNTRGQAGVIEHPLGTEDSGRDMLAVMIVGIPRTLMVGVIAATVGMGIGILLGFTAGFVGGLPDDIIRIITDVTITIPAILVLIVIQSVVPRIEIATMAFLISLFQWPGPTRLIRAQVLSMKSSGYVLMARLSGAPTRDIMFKEMMPNLLPYLAASFIGNTAGAIITAIGLEVLGLGPQRVHSLGVTIYFSINAAGILRQMWWWWGLPTIALIIIFIGLLLINLGLDEVANPRLRQASE
jgi:peptide/nickel transport system permease protein